jgi:Ser/Thr protein kinase RdoA (MazF antagonist)
VALLQIPPVFDGSAWIFEGGLGRFRVTPKNGQSGDDLQALVRFVEQTFGLDGSMEAVRRGAAGRVWRLAAGDDAYAVKVLFREPDVAAVEREAGWTGHFARAGIPLAESVPAKDGRIVVPLPAGPDEPGGWVRVYRWVEGEPVDPARAGEVAEQLGELLGRLHAVAPRHAEPDWWFDSAPAPQVWAQLLERARVHPGAHAWGERLAQRLPLLTELTRMVTPTPLGGMVVCHRDLHPENALLRASKMIPLDWDDVGAADPERELAMVLVRWFTGSNQVDVEAAQKMLDAYRDAGGTAQIGDERSFGMAVAGDLNFLRRQVEAALDPDTAAEHREHAELEIRESFVTLPTPEVLATLLGLS